MIGTGGIVTRLTWQAVGLLAVLGGVAVALAAVTDWGPAEILALIGILGGIGTGAAVGGVVAGGVSQRMDQVHAETQAQTPVLDQVARAVNGDLDKRINAGMKGAAVQVLDELRSQGVIR